MSKCSINRHKIGSFSPGKTTQNGSLDSELAAKLSARSMQDSQLWGECNGKSECNGKQTTKTNTESRAIVIVQKPLTTKTNDIDTILDGDF
jgi:hypothetical protein